MKISDISSYKEKLKDTLTWWLGKKRSFIINDEYAIELLFVDKVNNSAKIKITNLKNTSQSTEVKDGQE